MVNDVDGGDRGDAVAAGRSMVRRQTALSDPNGKDLVSRKKYQLVIVV